jgi:hypothetical protein
MSCPAWDRLVAHRYEGPRAHEAQEPPGWREALDHLDSCSRCREEALAADPSLVFRSLSRESTGPRIDAGEIEALRTGVHALRRAHRVEEPSRTEWSHRSRSGRTRSILTAVSRGAASRIAAAVILAAALLSVHPGGPARPDGSPRAGAVPTATTAARASDEAPPSVTAQWGEEVAAVDNFDRPNASIYYLPDNEMDLVMVVDPELDV